MNTRDYTIKEILKMQNSYEEMLIELLRLHLSWWQKFFMFFMGKGKAIRMFRVIHLSSGASLISDEYKIIGVQIKGKDHIHNLKAFKVWMKLK